MGKTHSAFSPCRLGREERLSRLLQRLGVHTAAEVVDLQFHKVTALGISGNLYGAETAGVGFNSVGKDVCN
ncbi:hypothetical protein ES703_98643 [subsurface metagenome]